ncbi:glutathione S-transferase [Pseudoxanthobacter sp. M-2]|uniref:glutathione S-transferase family protein n=1 Tax=Pseudoxanthobacter sp. M-2 TaxID=3078754 RepID=UPI0038FC59B4
MLKIWGRVNSTNVKKVTWLVGELGIAHERIDAGGQFGVVGEPTYRAMNPNGKVPTIDDDGFVLWESNTIVRYLAAKHDTGGLYPADLRARADAERWMDWTTASFAPPFTNVFLPLVRFPPEKRDPAAIAAAAADCGKLLAIVDEALAGRPFLGGDRLTVGDIPLGCAAYGYFNLPIERPSLPNVEAWYQRLTERKAYQDAVMIPLT